jgi:DNA repair photolyase
VCEHVFVRWDNLKVDEEERSRLPGYREDAVVRRFDAPEALDIRFYEVRSKSALNKVPERSRMPFRWTINPYRGCTHACTWCASGDTPILMADGRTRPLADVRSGDRIYGTVRQGSYRRYAVTDVLDHWQTVKPAYRVTLEDGTELITSGDHRFLTNRGWKHVVGEGRGPGCRPHLTINNKLIGTGQYASAPADTEEYRRGYLCGMIRGDGTLGTYSYSPREGRTSNVVHRFRLALIDFEALHRARQYLAEDGIATDQFVYRVADSRGQESRAIRASARWKVDRIRELIEWPRAAGDDWCKGFLAGIFDAEGCWSGVIRIVNTDPAIIDWTTWCLRRLGMPYVIEPTRPANGLRCVRIIGGLRENLRFFQTVDPSISRKRSIEGIALKNAARLKVESVEQLGVELPLFDITTGTGDFMANGVVSHNCFARPTHTYLGFNARRDFEREIVVKVNAPEVLRTELARPSWKGEHVALGTNTDPYQWVEGRYKLMRGIWEAMRDFANPCSVLTKSPLLLRDLDLMKEIAAVTDFTANLSIPSLDEKAWRSMEPHTPNPRARIEAVAELSRAGIPVGVLIAPLVPGVNDDPAQVAEIVEAVTDAGASSIGGIPLHLRGEVRDIWFEWLKEHRPDLIPRYEALYGRGAYVHAKERERIAALIRPTRPLKSRPSFRRGRVMPVESKHVKPAETAQTALF